MIWRLCKFYVATCFWSECLKPQVRMQTAWSVTQKRTNKDSTTEQQVAPNDLTLQPMHEYSHFQEY